MNWLNVELSTLRAHEYVGSEPIIRATWLNLLAYCCEQENGGRIHACKPWKSRLWEQTCGVTAEEVSAPSMLWTWQGDDLVVWHYPLDKETEVKRKRRGGYAGGKASGKARREAVLEGELERNGKEGKGKEGNSPPLPPVVTVVATPRVTTIPSREEVSTWAQMSAIDELLALQVWNDLKNDGWADRNGCDIGNWRSYIRRCVLDRMNGHSKLDTLSVSAQAIKDQEELRRVEARISEIRAGYSEHQTKSPSDIAELRRLKQRRDCLKKTLGFEA